MNETISDLTCVKTGVFSQLLVQSIPESVTFQSYWSGEAIKVV